MERRETRMRNAGRLDPLAHLAARPAVVAVEAVSRAAILAEWTGARIHILHISSAEELRPLREAKARGVDITGETCPQYLFLSTDDYSRLGGIIRVNPPVREARNQEPLWAALADGTIDIIATDHAPHAPRGKDAQRHLDRRLRLSRRRDADAADADRGRCRTHEHLRLRALERRQPGEDLGPVSAQGRGSGGLRGRSRAGRSRPQMDIDDALLQSRSKITPWHGRPVCGLPLHTLVRGRFVMRDRALVADTRGWGRSVHAIPADAGRRAAQCRSDDACDRPRRRPRAIGRAA